MLRIRVTFLSATTFINQTLFKNFFYKNHKLVDFTFVGMQQVGCTISEHVDATVASTKELSYKWNRHESERLTFKHNQDAKCTLYERKGLENSRFKSGRAYVRIVLRLQHHNNTHSYSYSWTYLFVSKFTKIRVVCITNEW